MAITTTDGLVAAAAAAITWPLQKGSFTPAAVAGYHSLWLTAGTPGAGVAPSSGVAGSVPTSATAGAVPFSNVTNSYMGLLYMSATQAGALMIYDRLWHNSGLSVTSTAGQTVNSVALTRPDALGSQVEAWLDIYAAMGAGTPAITLSYTDQDGNAANTATLQGLVSAATASRAFRFSLASGDSGVRSIQTYTASATMTSGTMGLVLRRRIAAASVALASTGVTLDAIRAGLPRINDSACLELMWQGAASATVIDGHVQIYQG